MMTKPPPARPITEYPTDEARRLHLEAVQRVASARRWFWSGTALFASGLLMFLPFLALYRGRDVDALGKILLLWMAVASIGGMAVALPGMNVRCPACQRRLPLTRALPDQPHFWDFCKKCGGAVEHLAVGGQGWFRRFRHRCTLCGREQSGVTNIVTIRHCTHCGLKLVEK